MYFASCPTLTSFFGLPRLKIWREARPFLFSMMRSSASMAVVDERERAALLAAVDELDGLLVNDVGDELREEARAAFLLLEDVVELRADPVEGAVKSV